MLSQTVEYALRAMVCLAAFPEDRVSAGALADRTHVPPDYLAKVLQLLSKADLIAGRRGVGGGYQIARDPKDVGVLEVIRAVGSLERITSCPLELDGHAQPLLCPLHHLMDQAFGAMIDVLDKHSLADIVEWTESNQPLCMDGDQPAPVSLGLRP